MDCSPPGSSVHGILQAKNTGMGCYFFLQGIFLIQESNLHFLYLLYWQEEFFFYYLATWKAWKACYNSLILNIMICWNLHPLQLVKFLIKVLNVNSNVYIISKHPALPC